ncbi:phosphoserine phosphatase 1 [mine drainage metagenome]|uniref:Phosphoserine phosphatase 1 n=1 Tax=mine drainage metagenome TaxID=410659 RepID=A0A1J5RQB9_9ZZZZ
MLQDQATLLLLIRHGETEWNRSARIQGHTDVALNARGQAQAEAVAEALGDTEIHAVYASDLLRARGTAMPIADRRGLALRTDAGLRERAFGSFEGRTFAQLQEIYPQECERWRRRDPGFAAPGGESLEAFYRRVTATVLRIAAAHPGQTLVIVTHGGALDCLHRCATGQSLDAPRTWELRNAAINRVLVAEDRMSLVGWNDGGHLDSGLDETGA